ncbi:MAG: T9SS type A sorting domain-containing protein [Lewinellaceae bacterium]|nr:T9SS type A sorting domain-containing protein [Lewinellaceae bacterium]
MRLFLTLIFILSAFFSVSAQQNFWTDVEQAAYPESASRQRSFVVTSYRALALDMEGLKAALQAAPMEFTPEATAPMMLDMPMPDGSTKTFEVVESPVMAPGLAARYPSIKTYKGWNPDNPAETIRFGYGPSGLYGTILAREGAVYIDTRTEDSPVYMSYFVKDNPNPDLWASFECETEPSDESPSHIYDGDVVEGRSPMGQITLRTFKLALSCTGEYAQHFGGTKELVMEQFAAVVNRLNQVFERDLAIRAELIENNDQIIFLNGDTDGLSNGQTGTLLAQNGPVINPIIGINSYDYGHVLNIHNNGSYGVALLSGACIPDFKAAGVSGFSNPQGDPFVISIVAHEMGHQFGANHIMSTCQNVNDGTAYEPGSGSTIMGYAGICPPGNNVQFFTDDYYNTISLQEIFTYTRTGLGNACPEKMLTENTEPTVEIPLSGGFYIPTSTPFELTAVGADAEGDPLTYCWEEFDLGPNNTGLGNPQGDSPIFRSFQPTESPTRVFPKLEKILSGNSDVTEVLPTYGRNLTFRCTVRDNSPLGGAAVWAQIGFKVDSTSGPFQVLAPNTFSDLWIVGANTEIRWDVANTDNDIVNCRQVNIKLSLDGGYTYPITLLENTDNDGSAFVTVPDAVTTQARVRIEAADNIFFDVSNQNFAIEAATEPGYALNVSPNDISPLCLPEPAVIEIRTVSILGYNEPITLDLIGDLPNGATYSFSQNPVNPSETASLTIEFNSFFEETLNLQIQAVTASLDTAYRELQITTASNDFSSMELLAPADGRDDIQLQTAFSWEGAEDAVTYDFQLATSASFEEGSIIEDSYGLTGTEYYPENFFDNNQRFFWRVRPVNECGPGPWLVPFVFQTISVDCTDDNTANDLPINLPNSSTTRTSTMFIGTDGVISDLNVKNVDVNFNPVRSLRISLVSPAGTRAMLFNRNCFTNSGDIELTFDDEAPEDIPCPPDDFVPAQPEEPLSIFDGENTAGVWTLEVQIVESGFGTGTIKGWQLEFCAATATTPPILLTNEVLAVPPGQGNTVTADYLKAEDDAATAEQLTYTLLQPPANGALYRWSLNEELATGSLFSQATIDVFNLVYVHDGSDTQEDSFTFIVDDGQGGFIPTQTFHITIDENAVVGTDEPEAGNALRLFPNPARDQVTIGFRQAIGGEMTVRLLNLQGQAVQQQRFPEAGRQLQLNTSGLPAGVYFVNVQTEEGAFTEKLILQR